MSWLGSLLGNTAGELVKGIGGIIDDLTLSGEEKEKLKLQAQALVLEKLKEVNNSARVEMDAKQKVLVAELTHGDNFTRRARPTVVYGGLVAIFLNYVIGPWAAYLYGTELPEIELPEYFWWAWGGIVSTWTIGRSWEKVNGKPNRITGFK